jgi:hypothetical protein
MFPSICGQRRRSPIVWVSTTNFRPRIEHSLTTAGMVIRTAQVCEWTSRRLNFRPLIAVRPSYSPRFHLTNFDCVLPNEARAELLDLPIRKTPARPLPVPVRKHGRIAGRAGWLALGLLVALILTSNLHFYHERIVPTETKATIQPTPEGELTLPAFRAELVRLPTPRAELVRLPAPRAELVKPHPPHALSVSWPKWTVGEDRLVLLPSGIQALARYKGSLADEGELPAIGNSLGDTWSVGDHVWLWLVAPGTNQAAWVDP